MKIIRDWDKHFWNHILENILNLEYTYLAPHLFPQDFDSGQELDGKLKITFIRKILNKFMENKIKFNSIKKCFNEILISEIFLILKSWNFLIS